MNKNELSVWIFCWPKLWLNPIYFLRDLNLSIIALFSESVSSLLVSHHHLYTVAMPSPLHPQFSFNPMLLSTVVSPFMDKHMGRYIFYFSLPFLTSYSLLHSLYSGFLPYHAIKIMPWRVTNDPLVIQSTGHPSVLYLLDLYWHSAVSHSLLLQAFFYLAFHDPTSSVSSHLSSQHFPVSLLMPLALSVL